MAEMKATQKNAENFPRHARCGAQEGDHQSNSAATIATNLRARTGIRPGFGQEGVVLQRRSFAVYNVKAELKRNPLVGALSKIPDNS